MLESLIGPDMMKKIMAKAAALISVILAWIGLMMIMMTVFVGVEALDPQTGASLGTKMVLFHVQFWPMLVAFACAAAGLVAGGRKTKVNLGWITFVLSLWVMLNAACGFVKGPVASGMGELVGPLMTPIQIVGGFMGVLAGAVGLGGAGKYMS